MADLDSLHAALRRAAPGLIEAIFDDLAPKLIGKVTTGGPSRDLNDPIWKLVTLTPLQTALIDTGLMQRLRRVRQLGLAHLVYPGAQHSRLEHSVGAMRAATIMYERLRPDTRHKHDISLREIVALAGLLHDCGHMAFSHVGERVMASLFGHEFAVCRDVLHAHFKDPVSPVAGPPKSIARKAVPAAELLSALFVISPAMIEALGKFGLGHTPSEAARTMCGLILGRPTEALRDDRSYHHYIKTIVSGDVDCDKIDYVARDAHFAGLPVSADVDRLLSQLATAKLDKYTTISDAEVLTGDPSPDEYHLMAIRPAGTSALEMFVMTRSYLFDRIYTHHKVRAAERSLERLLRVFLQFQITHRARDIRWCLDFMLSRGGDDWILGQLAAWEDETRDAQESIRSRALDILDRRIPKRAFAISMRTLADYQPGVGRPTTSTYLPWALAFDELAQNPLDMEDRIAELAGVSEGSLYFDWVGSNPVKENPDIWVKDGSGSETLLRVNQYFDVEQLSNAYRDVKMTGWVFCNPADRDRVAAATALALQQRYDILVGKEALRRAKVSEQGFQSQLKDIATALGPEEVAAVHEILNVNDTGTIRAPSTAYMSALTHIDEPERNAVAHRLSRAIAGAAIPRHCYDDLQGALLVLGFLLNHCSAFNRHEFFRRPDPNKNEARFQRHVRDFLVANEDFNRLFTVTEHTAAAGGFTDLIVSYKEAKSALRPIVVELKSAAEDWPGIYQRHAGQSQQYSEANYGRVSLLYCQYANSAATRVEDTLQARQNENASSPQATICLGQRAFWDSPSSGGSTTTD